MKRTLRTRQLGAMAVATALAVLSASSPLAVPAPAWGQDVSTASVCFISDPFGFRGTPGADVFQGSFLPEVAQGGGGPDSLSGEGGDDRLCGEAGDDGIDGGDGNDRLYGQQGNDTIDGGHGSDHISGGTGNDKLYGAGPLTPYSNPGRDNIYGGPGNDTIESDLFGGHISGGPGNDVIGIFGDKQRVYCGTGYDVVWNYRGRDHVAALVGCERVQLHRP